MLRTTPFPAMFFIYYISTQDNKNNKRKECIWKVYDKKESKLKTRKKIEEKKNDVRKSPGTNQGVYFILYKKKVTPLFFPSYFLSLLLGIIIVIAK
jgi:hypothetical protein